MIDFSKIKTLYVDGKEVKTFSLDGHEAWSYTPPTTLKPFTVENIDDTPNTYFPIQLKQYNGSATQLTNTIEYSVDDGQTWSNYTGSVYNLSCGQKISYRAREGVAVDATDVGIRPNGTTWFSTKLKVSGTLASLADKDMSGQHLRSFMFKEAFRNVGNQLVDASELIMPQINGENAYEGSFYGCAKLSAAPKEISADLSGKQDYFWRTFYGCTSLKETPRMHFQNIQNDCMDSMFYNCSQLSSIYIDFTAWPTDNWHGGIASFGKFRCPASLGNDSTIERDNAKKCPLNWVVGNFETNGWLLDNVVTRGSLTVQIGQALDFSQLSIYDGCSCELLVKDRDFTVQLPQAPIIGTNTLTCLGIGQFSGTKTLQYQIIQGNAFRMTAKEANSTIELSSIGTPPSISLLSSAEGLAWEVWNGSKLTLANPEDSVYLKAASTNDGFAFDTTGSNRTQFVMGGKIAVDGNVMDLLGKDTLSDACFYKLFAGCSSLVEAPDLPATTLAPRCYTGMFNGCSQLSTAPDLPALSAEALCYQTMFRDCASLTAAPALPATSLNSTCYSLMFFGCSSLTAAPALPATQLCSYCYWQMFGNCSSLTDAPALPAENLISNCYQYMFKGCRSLSSINVKFTDWLTSENATQDWLNGVAQSGTFTCLSALDTTTRGGTYVPASWTVVNPPPVVYAGYVQTNGYSLDTGHKPTVNTSLSACLSGNSGGTCFIGFNYGNDQQDYRVFNAGTTFYYDMGNKRINDYVNWNMSKWTDMSTWNYGFKFTPEGGSEHTATGTHHNTVDWDANGTINIAGDGVGANCNICIKGLKIYESGVLVKDFKPAVDSNSVACLHEEVEGVFCYPTGGAWTAYEVATPPTPVDTDGDGYSDAEEIAAGSDPNDPDSTPFDLDGDGFDNSTEQQYGSDPNDSQSTPETVGTDTDEDGYTDYEEGQAGTDPNDPSDYPGSDDEDDPYSTDSDGDGWSDGYEEDAGSDPNDSNDIPADTDGDGFTDYDEQEAGTDPNDPDDNPGVEPDPEEEP